MPARVLPVGSAVRADADASDGGREPRRTDHAGGKNGYVHDTYAPTKVVAAPAAAGPLVSGGTISVYVHVINNGSGISNGDVPDSQIASQINVLNAAYAPGGWQFNLAATDRTTNASWYTVTPGSTAETQMKNALRRGTADDLNLYTANLGQGLLGWATFPSGLCPQAEDGRRRRPLQQSLPGRQRRPRTTWATRATHEIGHWMGLYHTFQGGCAKQDRGATASPTPPPRVGGVRLPGRARHMHGQLAGIDPINNFMDYTDDACMDRFTAGQDTRMNQMFTAYRFGK